IQGPPFRDCRRQQRAVVLGPEVVVKVTREVLLDAEEPFGTLGRDFPFRLGRLLEVALPLVFFESHQFTSPIRRLIDGVSANITRPAPMPTAEMAPKSSASVIDPYREARRPPLQLPT